MKKMGSVVFSLLISGIAFSQPIVSITAPTNVTSTGFTLNGTVNNNGVSGGTISRMLVGTVSGVYPDSAGTDPGSTNTKITGSINTDVSRIFPNSGLPTILANTIYYYKLSGKNANGYVRSSESFFRTLPSNPTGLSSNNLTESSVLLSWNNTGSEYRIIQNTTGNATSPSDGNIIYEGSSLFVNLNGLEANTTYYFTLYARSSDVTPVFSASSLSVTVTTLEETLPVEMSDFGYSLKGNQIILNWETKTETGNYGWEVESRQIPLNPPLVKGETNGVSGEFQKIGFVTGKGTTTEKQIYSFASPITNHSSQELFRLKQIDTDGNASYSNVLSVNLQPEKISLFQNYPNPFNPETSISYQLASNSFVSLIIYDLLGKEIKTLVNKNKEAGNYTVDFDATNLPSGIYFYKLTAGKFSETKKMTVLK